MACLKKCHERTHAWTTWNQYAPSTSLKIISIIMLWHAWSSDFNMFLLWPSVPRSGYYRATGRYSGLRVRTLSLILSSVVHMSRRMTKPTKWPVRPAKAQISLGIRPVWSVRCLHEEAWRKLGSLATQWAHSEDSAQSDLSLCWAHKSFCWFCHFVGFEAAHLLLFGKLQISHNLCYVCMQNWRSRFIINWVASLENLSFFKQVRLIPACSATAKWNLEILDIWSIGIILSRLFAYEKRPRGRAVSAPDFGSRGRGFESRWRRDSSRT